MEREDKIVSPFSFLSLELHGNIVSRVVPSSNYDGKERSRSNERDWREGSISLSDFKACFRESLVSDLPTNRHI